MVDFLPDHFPFPMSPHLPLLAPDRTWVMPRHEEIPHWSSRPQHRYRSYNFGSTTAVHLAPTAARSTEVSSNRLFHIRRLVSLSRLILHRASRIVNKFASVAFTSIYRLYLFTQLRQKDVTCKPATQYHEIDPYSA